VGSPLEAVLIPIGVLCVIAAFVGGGLQGAGYTLPLISAWPREVGLGVLGSLLLLIGLQSRWPPPALAWWRRRRAPPPVPVGAALPPAPSDHFVGRLQELEEVHRLLTSSASHRLLVSGLGGIGKTQLAVQYLHAHLGDYPEGRFWLRGQDPALLAGDLVAMASVLELPELDPLERDQEKVIWAVMAWLQANQGWLLVVDNLSPEADEALQRWLPSGLRGHLLATSRQPLWGQDLPPLQPLLPAEAKELLLSRSRSSDAELAERVAERLGRLPLALEQAAAYLEQTGEGLAGYLQLLEEDPREMLAQGRLAGELEPVARTWSSSFRQVQRRSRSASGRWDPTTRRRSAVGNSWPRWLRSWSRAGADRPLPTHGWGLRWSPPVVD
jgi:hypothetical protein